MRLPWGKFICLVKFSYYNVLTTHLMGLSLSWLHCKTKRPPSGGFFISGVRNAHNCLH